MNPECDGCDMQRGCELCQLLSEVAEKSPHAALVWNGASWRVDTRRVVFADTPNPIVAEPSALDALRIWRKWERAKGER